VYTVIVATHKNTYISIKNKHFWTFWTLDWSRNLINLLQNYHNPCKKSCGSVTLNMRGRKREAEEGQYYAVMELGASQKAKDLINLFLGNTISSSPLANQFFALGLVILSIFMFFYIQKTHSIKNCVAITEPESKTHRLSEPYCDEAPLKSSKVSLPILLNFRS
jgi:hypothetical protein